MPIVIGIAASFHSRLSYMRSLTTGILVLALCSATMFTACGVDDDNGFPVAHIAGPSPSSGATR
jgi:hypothetical protein